MIYLTGDTHGELDIKKLCTSNFPEGKKMTKNDYVVILGDFGFIWKPEPDKTEQYWLDWFNNKPWTTLFVDGNHENHARLNEFSAIEWNGGKIHKINDSVFHLMRGQIFDIDNKKIFTMGGAPSIDKLYRVEGISWWKEEEISYEEQEKAISSLEKNGNKVDYIFTHTCPEELIPPMFNIPKSSIVNSPTEKFFDYIAQNVDFKEWYFGHWHIEKDFGKYHCLYDNIIRLE